MSRHPKLRDATPREIAPGHSQLDILFETQSAYMAHCDRFATRVTLRIEGQSIRVTSEHEVTRIEPLRDDF